LPTIFIDSLISVLSIQASLLLIDFRFVCSPIDFFFLSPGPVPAECAQR